MHADEEVRTRLTKVLQAFTTATPSSAPFKRSITSFLYFHRIRGRYKNSRFNSHTGTDRQIILQMLAHAKSLTKIIDNTPVSVSNLLPNLHDIYDTVDAFRDQGVVALKKLNSRKTKRSPYKTFAQEVELIAMSVFEQCHGKGSATVATKIAETAGNQTGAKTYGRYLDFVTEIFLAMSIEASAEGVIRTRLRKRRKSRAAL